ncbi:unnamed protein product [Rotaria sordida]|uniref:Uncharacterized protein n=1 Tax=Rotaria sordida TaxID=392033 RepID=A0A816C6F7_9BILA|nr:unnamed protein product [Rotaria sordida]CAF1617926.1 unnamed protein product [Rotaria sordida]
MSILTPLSSILSQSLHEHLPYTSSKSNLLCTCDPNTIFRYSARRNTDDLHYSPYSLSSLSLTSIHLLRLPPVGLNAAVYLWNANTSNVTRLCDLQTELDAVTSVAWNA